MSEREIQLSILTPAAPKRKARIAMILNRLKLNKERHPDIEFEFVIVDDSLDMEYQHLATEVDWGFPIKYISLPLTEPYPNPSYMRNVGFRIAEGAIFTMIDADHWVHEDFVEGAMEPFKVKPVLNTGFMIDTSKGSRFRRLIINEINAVNQELINKSDHLEFSKCMDMCGIKGPVQCNRVWLAAYPADKFLGIKGYDERYTSGYGREDDDIYFRLSHVCRGIHNQSFCKFAGVHLWHPQGARSDQKGALNRAYYNKVKPQDAERNQEHPWGKFVEGSFSIIDGEKREYDDHEQYVADLMKVIGYTGSPWKDFAELQACVTKK